jgi:hypothetical protein
MKYWGTEIKIGTSSIRKPSSTAGASGRKLSGVTSKRSKEYK